MKKKEKSSENDQLTGHFQSFFSFISVPPTLNLKKKSCKSTNKNNLALVKIGTVVVNDFICMSLYVTISQYTGQWFLFV